MDSGTYRLHSNILGVRGKQLNDFSESRLKQILRRDTLSTSDREAIEAYLDSATARSPEQNRARFTVIKGQS